MLRQPKKGWNPSHWASWKPFGIGEQYPNNYWEVFRAVWMSRDNLPYAWNVLNKGVCDGCALGTTGMKDWTVDGIHVCNVRLRLLQMNTMPAFAPQRLEDVSQLQGKKSAELREMGRLPYPMMRQRGEKGFRSELGRGFRGNCFSHPCHHTRPTQFLHYQPRHGQ